MTRDYYFRNRKSFTRYSSSRERERRLFYKPQHLTVPSGQNGSILIPANFVIWAGVEKFEFKIDKSIKSEAELEWLARELSDYLKIAKVEVLGDFYKIKRDFFREKMKSSRFELFPCDGTYFQIASYKSISSESDLDFSKRLVKEFGVAAIPLSVFNGNQDDQKLIRFCFAKDEQTLISATERLCKI
jgi:hypothetical protein